MNRLQRTGRPAARALVTARTSGPHITAQCRLPTRPRTNDVQISSMSFNDHEALFQHVEFAVRGPFEARLPKTRRERRVIHSLLTGTVRLEIDAVIKPRVRRAVQMQCAGEVRCNVS